MNYLYKYFKITFWQATCNIQAQNNVHIQSLIKNNLFIFKIHKTLLKIVWIFKWKGIGCWSLKEAPESDASSKLPQLVTSSLAIVWEKPLMRWTGNHNTNSLFLLQWPDFFNLPVFSEQNQVISLDNKPWNCLWKRTVAATWFKFKKLVTSLSTNACSAGRQSYTVRAYGLDD